MPPIIGHEQGLLPGCAVLRVRQLHHRGALPGVHKKHALHGETVQNDPRVTSGIAVYI